MSISQNFQDILPSLNLNFADAQTLDPRVSFSRASTGTYIGPDGLIKTADVNTPRFTYDPVTGKSLGLLIEESRTNLVYPSEPTTASLQTNYLGNYAGTGIYYYFSSTISSSNYNNITGLNIIPSNILNLNGYTGAYNVPWGGVAGGRGGVGGTGGGTNIATGGYISFFINPLTWNGNIYCGFLPTGNTTFIVQNINTLLFNNKTFVGNSNWVVRAVYPNGTYWLSRIVDTSIGFYPIGGSAFCLFTTTAGDNTSGFWFGGVQLENNPFPTSYIPTTNSTVTRAADVAQITGSNFSNFYNSNGTLLSLNENTSSSISNNILTIGKNVSSNISQTSNLLFYPTTLSSSYIFQLSGLDPDASSYISDVQSADGQSLETAVKIAINQFIVGCKIDGTWNAIKASCIMAGARTLNGALVPLVGTAPTNYNFVAGDYDRKTGLKGNGSTKYLNTNRADNADPQDSHHLSVYATSAATNATDIIEIGSAGGTTASQIGRASSETISILISRVFNIGVPRINASMISTGFRGVTRPNSSQVLARMTGQDFALNNASVAPSSSNTYVFARGTNLYGICDSRLSFYSIGTSLDLTLLDSRVTTLMNTLQTVLP